MPNQSNTFSPRVKAVTLLVTIFILLGTLPGCQNRGDIKPSADTGSSPASGDPDQFLVVDCLLPGQIRKLGQSMTYLSPRRPIRTTAINCEIRGGEYVSYDRANYATALNIWLPKAKEGDPAAQTYVGEIYEKGLGIEPDYQIAAAWYKKAADQGYTRAQINLGFLYEKGLGVPKDEVQALTLYRNASGLDESDLQFASTAEINAASRKEEQIEALSNEITRRRLEADELRASLARNQKELERRQQEIRFAQQQVNQPLQNGEGAVKTPVAGEMENRRPGSEQQQEIARLEQEIALQRSLMERELEIAAEQEERLTRELGSSRQESSALRSELQAARDELIRREEQLQEHRLAYEAGLKQLQRDDSTRDTRILEMEEQIRQYGDIEAQKAALADQLSQLEKELAQLQQQRQNAEAGADARSLALQQELASREEEMEIQRQQIAVLEERLETYSSLDAQQKALQVDRDRQARQIADSDARLKELEAEAIARKENILKLEEQIRQYGNIESQKSALAQQLLRLEDELARVQQQRQKAASDADSRSRELESQLAMRERELERQQEQIVLLEERLEGYNSLESQVKSLQQERAEIERERSRLEQQHAGALERASIQTAELKQILVRRENELQSQQMQIAALEDEVARQRIHVRNLEKQKITQTALPGPSIEIIEPPIILTRSKPSVLLRSATRQREIIGKVDAPAGLISVSVNDQLQKTDASGLFRTIVPVELPDTPVSVAAVDKRGQRASLEFTLIPKKTSKGAADSGKSVDSYRKHSIPVNFGNYHALIIGNNNYPHFMDLLSARNDAEEIDRILKSKYGFRTTLLVNADRFAILSALNRLREELTEKDNLLIYFAGHGELDRVNLRGHWLPVDAEPESSANWISNIQITDILNVMTAKHVMVVADSCYSGAMTRTSLARLQPGMSNEKRVKWMQVMAGARTRTVLTSGGVKPVLDQGGGKHSVFAKALIEVLKNNDQVLEGQSLYRIVYKQVIQEASRLGFSQKPQYAPINLAGHETGEFFFVPVN